MVSNAQQLITKIVKGNYQFVQSVDHQLFNDIREKQTPEITLLTCSDSRVQVNVMGIDALNEVFVVRNIGNQIMQAFGSVDYGILKLKTPLLLILGHSHCGAIKAVFNNYEDEPFDIIRELDHLSIPLRFLKESSSSSERDWNFIVEKNIDYQVKLALKKYSELVQNKSLTIVGAVDDFINDYGSGEGRLIFVNINGEKNVENMYQHELFSQLTPEEKKLVIKRHAQNFGKSNGEW